MYPEYAPFDSAEMIREVYGEEVQQELREIREERLREEAREARRIADKWKEKRDDDLDPVTFYGVASVSALAGLITYFTTGDPVAGAAVTTTGVSAGPFKSEVLDGVYSRIMGWWADRKADIYNFGEPW